MLCGINIPFKSIAEQAAALRRLYPQFTTLSWRNRLKTTGVVRPTSRSEPYTISIIYELKKNPVIEVLKPELVTNTKGESIPHLYYPERSLCLHRPIYGHFTYNHLITETILPWTCLWLYHYENWHATGTWKGGGEHPN